MEQEFLTTIMCSTRKSATIGSLIKQVLVQITKKAHAGECSSLRGHRIYFLSLEPACKREHRCGFDRFRPCSLPGWGTPHYRRENCRYLLWTHQNQNRPLGTVRGVHKCSYTDSLGIGVYRLKRERGTSMMGFFLQL